MKQKKIVNTGERLYKLFIYLVLGILAVLILVPVLWVMVASIKATPEHYGSPWALPTHIHWSMPQRLCLLPSICCPAILQRCPTILRRRPTSTVRDTPEPCFR